MSSKTVDGLSVRMNGEQVTTTAPTLELFLDEQGYANVRVATAVNGTFVAAGARAQAALKEGDDIEVVTARQGG